MDDVCCATIPFSSTTVDESREVGRQWRASPCHFSRTPYHTTGLTEGMISRHVAFVFFCFFPIFITLVKHRWGVSSILLIQTVKTLGWSVLAIKSTLLELSLQSHLNSCWTKDSQKWLIVFNLQKKNNHYQPMCRWVCMKNSMDCTVHSQITL